MATSRPIRKSEWLTYLSGHHIGGNRAADGDERPLDFILQSDFGLDILNGNEYRSQVCTRVFGLQPSATNASLTAAITNGTAPGLYVREGDDTSDWETYRQVLARRVEEAMAARRGGETPTAAEAMTETTKQQLRQAIGVLFDGREVTVDPVTGHVVPTTATRQDDEIRVGDVVEVVSCRNIDWTTPVDVGGRGRVSGIDKDMGFVRLDTQPREWIAAIADVRKVSSPSPQNTAASVSPMPDGEAARIEAAVADEVRRRLSLPLARSSDETTRQRVVNPVPPVVSVNLLPRDFTASAITDYLQSLGASHIRVYQTPENLPVVEVTGLSRQAFDTARQNLPVGVQLQLLSSNWQVAADDRRFATDDRRLSNVPPPSSRPAPQPSSPQPPPPSRFSLLEVDVDTDAAPAPAPQAPKPSTGLVALQQELRAEREAKRALAAAQTPPGRFDLLECDLPAVPTTKAPKAAPQRPVVSSSPKPQPRPVETITDLTTARSPLELARMLEGLNDELSTMMRQREAN